MMVFIPFLLLMILPSSHTLPQKSQNQPLQVQCPGDFNAKVGDVTGIGLGRFPVESIAECAEKCRQEPACNSFNYSPAQLHCVMYEETQPTAPKCEDFHFCMKNPPPPRLTTFAVDTTIQFRYARTSIHLEAVNPSEVPQQFPFIFTLPESAFVMNMSLTYDGVEHVARVEEKELAEQQYQKAVNKGESAAQVKKTERDSKKVSVDVNIEPGETISMVVTYEELLDRKLGRYKYSANINPGSVVDNYTVNIHINESLPIKDVQSFKISDNNHNEDKSVGLLAALEDVALGDVEFVGENTATITYNPSRQDQEQERVGRHGITGQINVEYDVDRNNEDNIVQLLDGYFVHFFAPENEDPLPKHIIFVLDTSGSMEGIKMEQLKNAMVAILDEITVRDYISIISFSDAISIWDSSSHQDPEFRNEASRFILELDAVGGTDINEALLTAINQADTLKKREENVHPIIFFLTDGNATVGETNPEIILENLHNRNHQGEVYVPIISLAFGADADFVLLKYISLNNFGFAKKIYEGADAEIQLERFYQTIAEPVLKNVKFEYVGDIWEKNTLSESGIITTIFKGGENIAVGKLSSDHKRSASENKIIIKGKAANGGNKYNHSIGFTEITNISSSSDINFVERLWAFKTIKLLLTADPEDPTKEATNLSLKYSFVTELTSLIVTKPGEEQAVIKPIPRPLIELRIQDFYKADPIIFPPLFEGDIAPEPVDLNSTNYSDFVDKSGTRTSLGFRIWFGETAGDTAPEPVDLNSTNYSDFVERRTSFCGRRTSLGYRITFGETAVNGQFPWTVSLVYRSGFGRKQNLCGGALVTDRHVVTAAHCVSTSGTCFLCGLVGVWIGDVDLSGESGVEIGISAVILHENFHRDPVGLFDIAIIKLSQSVVLTNFIRHICLFSGTDTRIEEGVSEMVVAGWGRTEKQRRSGVLKYTYLNQISNEICQSEYTAKEDRLGKIDIREDQLCAKGEHETDSCGGDSGGPLMAQVDGVWYLAGVVSFGTLKCDSSLPGVYTRISSFEDWLHEVIDSEW